jgi:hypothetical protein
MRWSPEAANERSEPYPVLFALGTKSEAGTKGWNVIPTAMRWRACWANHVRKQAYPAPPARFRLRLMVSVL